jgi:hypothetical protein
MNRKPMNGFDYNLLQIGQDLQDAQDIFCILPFHDERQNINPLSAEEKTVRPHRPKSYPHFTLTKKANLYNLAI